MAVARLVTLFEDLDTQSVGNKSTSPNTPLRHQQSPAISSIPMDHYLSAYTPLTNSRRWSSSTQSIYSPSPSPSPTSSMRSVHSFRSPRRLRRQPSTIDLALAAERAESGAALAGLGLMEPRPVPHTHPTSQDIFNSPSTELCLPPTVMEGIFEVMESTP